MTPEQAMHLIQGSRPLGVPGNSAIAATGEEFVTFVVGVVLNGDEGLDHDAEIVTSMAEDIRNYFAHRASRSAPIYWRRFPHFEVEGEGRQRRAKVRCRLLISDATPKERATS